MQVLARWKDDVVDARVRYGSFRPRLQLVPDCRLLSRTQSVQLRVAFVSQTARQSVYIVLSLHENVYE